MTRLFGCVCNQTKAFGAAIEPVRQALALQGPVGRWGFGYLQWGEVCLKLFPRGSEEGVDFYESLSTVPTDYVVGCVSPDDGLTGNANTQPFRFRHWLGAQEGPSVALDRTALNDTLPGFLQRNLKGKTAAELVFHLFLAALHKESALDNVTLPVEAASACVATALRNAEAHVDGPPANWGNLLYTNGRSMFAIRLGGPLFVCRLKHRTDPKRPESELRAAVLISADENPGEGFEEVPLGTVIAVRREVTTDILPFAPSPAR